MSLTNFDTLTASFPDDKDAILRIAELIEESSTTTKTLFSVTRITDRAAPISQFTLAYVLQQLESLGILKKIIRVTSKEGVGIKDFTSILDIPETILDRNRDINIVVEPEDLHIFYQVVK